MTVTVYTFEDKDGNESGSYHTQNYEEARQHAMKYRLKVIANNFELDNSELIEDFTEVDPPALEDQVNAKLEAVAEALLRKQLGPQDA